MQQDPAKIAATIKFLKEQTGDDWIPGDGYHAILQLTFEEGKPVFSTSVGAPVKIFANQKTGEVRTFLLRDLKKENPS